MKAAAPFLIVSLALILAVPAQARQGVSESMAECGALMDVTVLHTRSPDRKKRIERAAQVWAEAAGKQADIEGWIAGDLTTAYSEKRNEWASLGPAFMHTQEYRDWASYCRALALRYKVDVP